MAAYAALLSLTQILSQSPVVHQTEHHILGFLHEKLNFLLSFLEEDYAEKNSETFRCLEGRIRDVTYEAEDIIESQILNQIRSESRIENQIVEQKYEDLQKIIGELDIILEEAQKIIGELDIILKEVQKMKGVYLTEDQHRIKSSSGKGKIFKIFLKFVFNHTCFNHFSTSHSSKNSKKFVQAGSQLRSVSPNTSTMVGFHDESMQIKDRLTGSSSKLEIISIVGMGGIGKTTLARNVYDDSLIMYHFDTRAWITVSQKYHIQEMLTDLLDCTGNLRDESNQEDIGKLAERLYKSLKGKRYLIVMDDVWDTKAWDDVKRLFPDDKNGSRIILTTRLSDVAVYANTSCHICHLNLQSSEESWKMLQHKVFGEENCPLELEKVGKEIAENSKGLPLALAVIGGLLYKGERTLNYWMQIKQNVNSALTRTDDQFMEIISLSYNNLPHHLRACFLYMGVFPEDHKIRVSILIKLWVAEGFVKPVESKSLEEVAEKYLEDLVGRNMILVHERNFHGEMKICGIHDLVRDLCVRKAQEEKFLQVVDPHFVFSPKSIHNQRCVSVHSDSYYVNPLVKVHSDSSDDLENIYDSRVRSLVQIYRYQRRSENLSVKLPLQRLLYSCELPLLRVLHSSDQCPDFAQELVELVNLRYIALDYVERGSIPASISKLSKLQTLIIENIGNLPSEIWKMPQLRHILIRKCFLPYPSGDEVVPLENLQTLDRVMYLTFTKDVLRIIPNLKKLAVDFRWTATKEYTELPSYCIDNLIHLHQLEDLKCFFFLRGHHSSHRVPLQENLGLPTSLKKLTLSGNCRLSSKNMSVLGSLPNLEGLKLKSISFVGQVWEPNEGEFCKLKFLQLSWTDLKHWNADETHFPNLQHISLVSCRQLVEIPSGIGDIPTLQEIKLHDYTLSAVSSAKSIQEEQQNLGNYYLQIICSAKSIDSCQITEPDEDDVFATPVPDEDDGFPSSKEKEEYNGFPPWIDGS